MKAALSNKSGNIVLDNLYALAPDVFQEPLKRGSFSQVNESVYKNEDYINFLYFPIDCVFSTVAMMEDGASVEVSLAGNKSLVGINSLFNSPVSHFWTNVMIPGNAFKIERQIFQEVLNRNVSVRNYLLQLYLSALSHISQRAICNGKHNLAQRFSSWLLMLFDQTNLDVIPLTHDTIAQKLGSRRAGITKAAGNLQTARAILYNRGLVRLLARNKIEREACECYEILKYKI